MLKNAFCRHFAFLTFGRHMGLHFTFRQRLRHAFKRQLKDFFDPANRHNIDSALHFVGYLGEILHVLVWNQYLLDSTTVSRKKLLFKTPNRQYLDRKSVVWERM